MRRHARASQEVETSRPTTGNGVEESGPPAEDPPLCETPTREYFKAVNERRLTQRASIYRGLVRRNKYTRLLKLPQLLGNVFEFEYKAWHIRPHKALSSPIMLVGPEVSTSWVTPVYPEGSDVVSEPHESIYCYRANNIKD